MTARRSSQAIILCVVATVGLLAADLWTKEWASDNLSHERPGENPPVCAGDPIRMQRLPLRGEVLIEGYLELQYAENCGAAFGLLRDAPSWLRRSVFGLAALAAAIVLMWMFVMNRGGRLFAWSVPLIISGALGNLVDRARLGYVVDFIRFHVYDSFEYPTFNVADITITVGVALLVLDGLLAPKETSEPAEGEAEDAKSEGGEGGAEPSAKRRKKKVRKRPPGAAPVASAETTGAAPSEEGHEGAGGSASADEPPDEEAAEPRRDPE